MTKTWSTGYHVYGYRLDNKDGADYRCSTQAEAVLRAGRLWAGQEAGACGYAVTVTDLSTDREVWRRQYSAEFGELAECRIGR
jgi:hypothetical protein